MLLLGLLLEVLGLGDSIFISMRLSFWLSVLKFLWSMVSRRANEIVDTLAKQWDDREPHFVAFIYFLLVCFGGFYVMLLSPFSFSCIFLYCFMFSSLI